MYHHPLLTSIITKTWKDTRHKMHIFLNAPLKRFNDPEVRLAAFLRVRVVSVVGVQIRHSHHERYQHLQQTAFMTRIQATAHV